MAGPSSQITKGFQVRGYLGFDSVPTLGGKAGASTIAVGDFLSVSAGLLVPASQGDDAVLVGIATSASTASGTTVTYVPLLQGVIVEATLDGGTNANVALVDTGIRFESFGLGKDTGNAKFFIDKDNTTDTLFTVIDFVDAIGTTRGRVKAVVSAGTGAFGA